MNSQGDTGFTSPESLARLKRNRDISSVVGLIALIVLALAFFFYSLTPLGILVPIMIISGIVTGGSGLVLMFNSI